MTTYHIPDALVRRLAVRRAIIFVGAGVSAACLDINGNRPPSWAEFLQSAIKKIQKPKRAEANKYLRKGNYLMALQAVAKGADVADYRSLLSSTFNNPAFKPSPIHETIVDLDAPYLITTNFDKLLESTFNQYSKDAISTLCYYSDSLGDAIRGDDRVLIKAHGTVDEITKVVFTKPQYNEAKRTYQEFYEILKALFLTHTCLFIGCGLEDPDLLLVLEEVRNTATSARPHYALMKSKSCSDLARSDLFDNYNIEILDYGKSYDDLPRYLSELNQNVQLSREAI